MGYHNYLFLVLTSTHTLCIIILSGDTLDATKNKEKHTMNEAQLKALIFDTAKHHLNYGKGTPDELKNPYCGTDEENDHQSTVWGAACRETEDEWIYALNLPENLADPFWQSVQSQLLFDVRASSNYPEIHWALIKWTNA